MKRPNKDTLFLNNIMVFQFVSLCVFYGTLLTSKYCNVYRLLTNLTLMNLLTGLSV